MNPVIVERSPADRQGPDISDPLIEVEPVAVARGISEIDYTCTNRKTVAGAMPIQDYLLPRDLVSITDMENGVYPAQVDKFAITIDKRDGQLTAQASIQVEKKI